MAMTIPGGAYLSGNTWKDAEGKPLGKGQIEAIKELGAAQAADRDERQLEAMALEADRDPTARALARALKPKPAESAPLVVPNPPKADK